jgi:hypothetical protein
MVAEMMGKCGKFMGQSSRNDGLNMFEIWNTCFFWGGKSLKYINVGFSQPG